MLLLVLLMFVSFFRAAGYSFSRGHFVVNVPYDYLAPMIFQGEEMSKYFYLKFQVIRTNYEVNYDYHE